MDPISRRRALASLVAGPLAAAGATLVSRAAFARDATPDRGALSGLVFTSSNSAAGNDLLVFGPAADGSLQLQATLATGGLGSGAGLGSQGAVTLSGNGRRLYVVNAGSNSVSTFVLQGAEIRLQSVVDSGGLHPISVTEDDGIVYVLNDGGAGNIAGFVDHRGTLQPVAGSQRALSTAGGSGPAQVSFAAGGRALVVTEKVTNRLLSWAVGSGGPAATASVADSPGQTPFGFAVTRRGLLVVSEAWGGAAGASTVSSWQLDAGAGYAPRVVSAAVANGQGAACWAADTPDGRFVYVANTGSSTLSLYAVGRGGTLSLVAGAAASTGAGSAPADTVVSADGRRVTVRNGRTFTLASYAIGEDGLPGPLQLTPGLPATAVGLAAS